MKKEDLTIFTTKGVTMQVAILVSDGGDGCSYLRWFKNIELAIKLANDDKYCEDFGCNEGGPTVITVGDDFSPQGGFDDNDYADD